MSDATPQIPRPADDSAPTAVVTGASSGIGRATAQRLAGDGWRVLAVARREERLAEIAATDGVETLVVDVTDQASVDALAAYVQEHFGGRLHAVANIAGGAFGQEPVAEADLDAWERMYAANVLGTGRVTRALLPALRASGRGSILILSSTAGQVAYEGGAGYNAAKAGQHMIAGALRLELNGEPVRVIEIAPGMVRTEEFSLVRLGDSSKADGVYDGVESPLTAEDVADVVSYSLNVPHHVNLDLVTIRPIAQAAAHKVARNRGL